MSWALSMGTVGAEKHGFCHKRHLRHFIMLQHNGVPYYWIISPEDKALIAYALSNKSDHVVFSVVCGSPADLGKVRIPPFEELDIDLRYVFGDEE